VADDKLDPGLAEAYRAERSQVDGVVRDLEAVRERVLLAAAARAVVRPFWTAGRVVAALLVTAVLAGGLGYWAGRGEVAVIEVDAGAADAGAADATIADAARPDAVVAAAPADAAPSVPAKPRRTSGELNEPLLIDQARAALRRKLIDEALAALAQHEARYPDGQLVEEREVLRIEAALLGGDLAAARARIQAYRRRFPDGFLREHVEALVPGNNR
jgi:hypothetical protein